MGEPNGEEALEDVGADASYPQEDPLDEFHAERSADMRAGRLEFAERAYGVRYSRPTSATGSAPQDALPRDDRGLYDLPTDADPLTGEVVPGWDKTTQQVMTLEGAFHFGRLAREAGELVDALEADGRAEVARLRQKLKEVRARTENLSAKAVARKAWLKDRLDDFAARNREMLLRGQPKNQKSVTYPSGLSFAWRKKPARLRVLTTPEAESALLEWARGRDSRRLVSEAVNWLEVTRLVRKDEPAPPGTEWVQESETLTVKVGGDDDHEGKEE